MREPVPGEGAVPAIWPTSSPIGAGMITIYGIKNCDTMKKARAWLAGQDISHAFHDYKASGIDRASLTGWVGEHGWETVLNRAGTTFRALPEADRQGLDADRAIALMLAQPSMIKRPVLDLGDRTIVGFKPEVYAAALAKA
jgi:arsenate reductase